MPQGKLFMDKQNLSLQRQKQSRSSWKDITWCSVNNSYGFSSSVMREIQNNLELCRSYLLWECNHFINVCLKMRAIELRSPFPPYCEATQIPQEERPPLPTLLCLWKVTHRAHQGRHPTQHCAWHMVGAQQNLAFNTLVKLCFCNMKMKTVLSWK